MCERDALSLPALLLERNFMFVIHTMKPRVRKEGCYKNNTCNGRDGLESRAVSVLFRWIKVAIKRGGRGK